MQRKRWRCLLFAACLGQMSCAPIKSTDFDSLPAEEVPVGSLLFLNRDIIVNSGLLGMGLPSLQIQHGRLVKRLAVQQFEPYCEFILNAKASGESLISSDGFIVDDVSRSRSFMRRDSKPALIAAGPGFKLAKGDNDGTGYSVTLIDYSLSSEVQGSGYTLRCRAVSEFASAEKFTIGLLRDTLGSLFTLQMVDSRSLEVQ